MGSGKKCSLGTQGWFLKEEMMSSGGKNLTLGRR
jgi:hypothetical protein